MPEHIRALIVVLLLSTTAWVVMQPSIARTTSNATAREWRNTWIILTLVAFIAGNFWIYALLASLIILTRQSGPVDSLAFYCLLLFVVPAADIKVPGFGLINYFFTVNQPRLLSLVLLVPAAIALRNKQNQLRIGSTAADKLLIGYIILTGALQLREANITSTLRGCFYLITDIFLPYYVASRALQHTNDFRKILQAFSIAIALLGILAFFETLKHWNLYAALTRTLGIDWGYGNYLARDGLLRASASVGQPIVLGYLAAIGLTFSFFLQKKEHYSVRDLFQTTMIIAGLLAALSRGPWVGAALMILIFVSTGRHGVRNIFRFSIFGIIGLGALTLFGAGQRLISLMPFIGNIDSSNVTYRQKLLDNSLDVISRNFWLGSVDFRQTPEMQEMIQGEGIIDIVNVYLGTALNYGVIGLALFTSFFAIILWKTWRTQAQLSTNDERRVLGRSLFATLAGISVMISSVASITVVGQVFWLVAGLCVAWIVMIRRNQHQTAH